MNAINSFQLIPTDQLQKIEAVLFEIKDEVLSLKNITQKSPDDEILTTKEAMKLLKICHVNTFKDYLTRNNIHPIDEFGPKRYLKSHLIKPTSKP